MSDSDEPVAVVAAKGHARVKLTARKSTGGVAPRKELLAAKKAKLVNPKDSEDDSEDEDDDESFSDDDVGPVVPVARKTAKAPEVKTIDISDDEDDEDISEDEDEDGDSEDDEEGQVGGKIKNGDVSE